MSFAFSQVPFSLVTKNLPFTLGAIVLGVALGRVHLRAQTTLIGYEIGRLKSEEASLLEERSALEMQLAKLTTRKRLTAMTEAEDTRIKTKGTLAQK